METFKSDIVTKHRIYRWDIYYCSLDQDIANSDSCLIGKPNRPCLIISNDDYNMETQKVLVLPFCSCNLDMTEEEYIEFEKSRGQIVIPMTLNREKTSFLILNQPRLIYQKMLQGYVGTLDVTLNPKLAGLIDQKLFEFIIDKNVFCSSDYFKSLLNANDSISNTEENPKELEKDQEISSTSIEELSMHKLGEINNCSYLEACYNAENMNKNNIR